MPYAVSEINELHEGRVRIGNEVRAMYDTAKREKRSLTGEEEAQIDALLETGEKLMAEARRKERLSGIESEDVVAQRTAPIDPNAGVSPANMPGEAEERGIGTSFRDTPEYRNLFRSFLAASGQHEANEIAARARQMRLERRDLQVDNDTQAGFLVPPEQFVAELIKEVDDQIFVRQWARRFTVHHARSLGAPKRTARLNTWAWGSEIANPTADTTLAYGKRALFPHHASGLIKISNDFLRSSVMSAEQIVQEEMARDAGELLEDGYLLGSGAGNEPLGIFTASADGIPTSRDVSTGNTATEIKLDGLIEAKFSIKEYYWPRLRLLTSRTGKKQMYAMRDNDGRPVFVESWRAGGVDRVIDVPVTSSERAPSTFTTGLYVGIMGDFSTYWIADALDMELKRLDELYALDNKVGFIGRLKTDGMPVLDEAWARIKLG